jgi:hypothetical protein
VSRRTLRRSLAERCFQIVECDDPALLQRWMDRWRDLVSFDVTPIVTSAEAVAAIAPRLEPSVE